MSEVVKRQPALALLLLASLLGAIPLTLVATGVMPAGFSQLGALSASSAAILLAAIEGGRQRVSELLRRGLIWRVGTVWWATALLYTAPIALLALYLAQWAGGPNVDLSRLGPVGQLVPMMLILVVFAGLGEEFGWRGYLLPRLQRRHDALVSSLIVGVAHSLWHIPLFLVDGTAQHEWAQGIGLLKAIVGYSVFVIAWAVHLTWVFNNTRGSVLLVAVAHGAGNAWIGGYVDVYGRAGVLGNNMLTVVMAVVAVALVVVAGRAHLSRRAERDVLAATDDSQQELT